PPSPARGEGEESGPPEAGGEGGEGRARRLRALLDAPPEQVGWFLAVGYGHLIVEALFDAMEHEHQLDAAAFALAVRQAAERLADGDAAGCRDQLQAAADRLLAAREVLYPMGVHVLDLAVVESADDLPAAFARRRPLNLIASAAALERLA